MGAEGGGVENRGGGRIFGGAEVAGSRDFRWRTDVAKKCEGFCMRVTKRANGMNGDVIIA